MTALLELQGLNHTFGGLRAVAGLDLQVQAGTIHGIIGPNGSGKTTTFNLISGIHTPLQGRICFRGQDLAGRKPFEISRLGIARTFQNLRVFPSLTVLDHVLIGRSFQTGLVSAILRRERFCDQEAALRRDSLELLDQLHLRHRALTRAGALSYGEQRRLEIARALAARPMLILLDEPAAGMNPAEVDDLMGLIRRLRDDFKVTVLLIEHHMKVVLGLCQEILVMDFGMGIAQGTAEAMVREPKVREAYLGTGRI